MAKRMSPYSYFAELSLGEIKPWVSQPKNKQPPEPKVIYVDKPYPVEIPKPVEVGSPSSNTYSIPWGLITILGIVGILSVSIVAIVVGRKG